MTGRLHAELLAIEAEIGRRRLRDYVRLAWSEVEPNALKWNWHIDAICDFLEAVRTGDIRNGLILQPPGTSKSLIVSTFFPAWSWIQDPTLRWIFASYAQDISEKNARLHRDLIKSEWHAERWPSVQIAKESLQQVRLFENTSKGWRFSSAVGGQMTGRHGDILVFDDLVKAQIANQVFPADLDKANDFWFSTMHTRRSDAGTTRKLGVMQRLHDDDPAAKCIATGEYEVLCLPMEFDPPRKAFIQLPNGRTIQDPRTVKGELLDPARFSAETIAADKTALTPLGFEGQCNQNPVPRTGTIFKRDMFKFGSPPKGARKIITVDCAFKDLKSSDGVAIQCWAVKDPDYYLVDQIYGHFDVLETAVQIAEMKDRQPESVGVYVEDKANGPAIIVILRGKIPGLIAWPEKGSGLAGMSKVSRAHSTAALVDSGNVYLPESAPWVPELLVELAKFPNVRNDDRTDALTMGLLILHRPMHRKYADAVRKWLRS